MENQTLVFGHKNPDTDSICSSMVKEILDRKSGHNTKAVRLGKINKETEFVLNFLNIEAPELIEEVEEGQPVFLVDHNEFNQSVKGIEKAKIVGVTDHHRIANFETPEPIYYNSRPFGCTSTILFDDFIEYIDKYNKPIERTEAVLMLSAIISDTLLLKSPTTTDHDRKALKELGEIANIDVKSYGLDMLKAGTALDDFSAEELINLDAKELEKDGIKYVIAQVNTVSIEDALKREDEFKQAINKEIKEKDLKLFVLAITDILNSNSEIIVLGEKSNIIKPAFGKDLQDDKAFLEGVVSRKKQLLPNISNNI